MKNEIKTSVNFPSFQTPPVFSFYTPDSITVLVNKSHPLPKNYKPYKLIPPSVPFDTDEYSEKHLLRPEAATALEELFLLAEHEQISLCAISGFRSYERQEEIYKENLQAHGTLHTSLYSAKPGCSEHQTGLAMDVSTYSINYALEPYFAETREGIWLEKNACRCGFILRYPKDKVHITGYAYEPWHLRFVGVLPATYLTKKHLTLEECTDIAKKMDISHNV